MKSNPRPTTKFVLALAIRGVIGSLAFGAPCLAMPAFSASDYQLRYGDSVTIQVVGQPDLAIVAQPIRPDGNITLPLVEEVPIAGKTVSQVTAILQSAYKRYVSTPHVTVYVARFRPTRVAVLGQVSRPGNLEFQEPPRLVDVLAAAGGLTDRAARRDIRVKEDGRATSTYDLDNVLNGSLAMPIVPDDATVEVSEVWYPDMYRFIPIAASIITAAAVVMR